MEERNDRAREQLHPESEGNYRTARKALRKVFKDTNYTVGGKHAVDLSW